MTYALAALLAGFGLCVGTKGSARADFVDNVHGSNSYSVHDNCHGEELLVEAAYHGVVKVIFNKDGSVTYDLRVNTHGVAHGMTSGMEYLFNDTYREKQTLASAYEAFQILKRSRFISPGSNQNLIVLFELRYHYDPDGYHLDLESTKADCHG